MADKSERGFFYSVESQVFNSIAEPFFMLDESMSVLFLNSASEKFTEKKREELSGKNFAGLFEESFINLFKKHAEMAAVSGNAVTFEFFFDDKNKAGAYEVILCPSGRMISVLFRPIAGKQDYKNIAMPVENLYRLISENSRDLVCIHRIDGTYIYLSPAVKEILGYTPDELEGKNPYDFFHPDDIDKIRDDSHMKAVSGDLENKIEYRMLAKDGSYVWLETVTRLIDDQSDLKIITSTRNITSKKKNEIELLRHKILFETIIDSAPVGIWVTDAGNDIILANNFFARAAGIDSGGVIKYSSEMKKILVHEALDPAAGMISTSIAKFEFSDGQVHTLQVLRKIISDPFGDIIGTLGIGVDITELENAQRELIAAKQAADEARAAAEKAGNSKSEFIANISHEIKTPLNAVTGFSELLRPFVSGDTPSMYLEGIISGAQTLLSLINDILDFSRIESGMFTINYYPADIHKIIREVESIFLSKKIEKGLDFTIIIDPHIKGYWMLDELRIKQMLINLLSNAFKFTHKGGVKLSVSSDVYGKEKAFVIEVADTGIGINPDQADLIFQPFRQHDGQSTRKYGGTGLGLSITKSLVEMMNGQISLESSVGKGAIFKIMIPAVEADAGPAGNSIKIEENKSDAGNMRQMFVIDDYAVNDDENFDLLVKEFGERWKRVSELMSNDDIALFAADLFAFAVKIDNAGLAEYAIELKKSSESFDIKRMISIFREFENILNRGADSENA